MITTPRSLQSGMILVVIELHRADSQMLLVKHVKNKSKSITTTTTTLLKATATRIKITIIEIKSFT